MGVIPIIVGIPIPDGSKAIHANRAADNLGDIILLSALLLSTLISGYIAPSFNKKAPIPAGFLAPIIPCAGLIIRTHPSDNDVPQALHLLCYICMPLVGAFAASLKQKIRIRGRCAAIIGALVVYCAVFALGVLFTLVFKAPSLIDIVYYSAVYAAIIAGTGLGTLEDRHTVFKGLGAIVIAMAICDDIYNGIYGTLEKIDLIRHTTLLPIIYIAYKTLRQIGWIQKPAQR